MLPNTITNEVNQVVQDPSQESSIESLVNTSEIDEELLEEDPIEEVLPNTITNEVNQIVQDPFRGSVNIEALVDTSEIDVEPTEEDLALLEEILANPIANEATIQVVQGPSFSTVLDFEKSISMEDFLNSSQRALSDFDEIGFSDDVQDPFSNLSDFDESISVENFLNDIQIDEELTEEDFVLLKSFFADDITDEVKIENVPAPLLSTIFDFEESISVKEFLSNSEIDVELTEGDIVLVEAVLASALTNEVEIRQFETPTQIEEKLPIAPAILAAEELPMLMQKLTVADQDSVPIWQNIDSQHGFSATAAAASTIVQWSSVIMGGFSNIQFTSTSFFSSSTVFYSHTFSNPFHTYPTITFPTRMGPTRVSLAAFPQNARPGEYLTLVGKVQDQFGRPIPGAQVRIIKTDERGWISSIATTRTDFAGNYVLRTIATPGVYWYRSEHLQMPRFVTRGYSNAIRVVSIPHQNWEVALTAMPTTGHIGDKILLYGLVLSDGYPVGGGRVVELQYQHGGRWYRIAQRQTDAQGVFAYPLQAVAPGPIIVRAVLYDPYGVQKVSNPVTLNIIGNPKPFLGNTGLTLYAESQNLPSFGSTAVYGWLSTSSGMPLVGMPIVITSEMQQGNSATMRTTEFRQTGADGSFELPVVASQGSGTITVHASFQGSGQFSPANSRPLTINFGRAGPILPPQPPQVNRQVQITAQYLPTNPLVGEDTIVSGTLTTSTGVPVAGVLITGTSTIMGGICHSTTRNSVTTDMNGNYRYVFQPSCEGQALVTVKFDGTQQFRPVSISFGIPIGGNRPIPMNSGPIIMMSSP